MGLRAALDAFRLWRQYRRAKKALEKEAGMFDRRKMFLKGLKALGVGALSVAGAALLGWLADPVALTAALEDSMSPALIAALVPLINAAAEMARNALKHNWRMRG